MIERGKDRRYILRPSRAMISGELSWAAIAFVLGWSGAGILGMDGSYLNQVLEREHWLAPALWIIVLGVPAAALFIVSGWEYALSQRQAWPLDRIERWAAMRARLVSALAFSWLYMLYALDATSARPSALRGLGVLGFAFCAWFVIENRRVRRHCRKWRESDGTLADA